MAVVAPRPAEMPGLVAVVEQRVVRDHRPLGLIVERVGAPRLEAVEGEVVAYQATARALVEPVWKSSSESGLNNIASTAWGA